MRTKNLFKMLAVASLMFTALTIKAQDNKTTTGSATAIETTANEATDYVTVGSIMPYSVDAFDFLSLSADFDPSTFNWSVSAGAKGTDWEVYDPSDASVIATPATSTLNAINIEWLTTGNRTVSVQEISNPKVGTGCSGIVEDLPVVVLNRPSIAWPATVVVGACNTVTGISFNIPADVTGTDLFKVVLSCTRTNFDAGATTTSILASQEVSPTFGDIFDGTVYQTHSSATIYALTVASGVYGKYVFTIEGITDRISRKSGIATDAADYPASTSTYTVIVYPTPTTGKVKHVANNVSW